MEKNAQRRLILAIVSFVLLSLPENSVPRRGPLFSLYAVPRQNWGAEAEWRYPMPFFLIRNDITAMKVDAIVNTANPKPVIGRGTDYAIHAAAGPELLEAREAIGPIAVGEARITPAFHLEAKYVIHTVGPMWADGQADEMELLRRCYENSLLLAAEYNCQSIAFPLISTGFYRIPQPLALRAAADAIHAFLGDHDMDITLVVFDRESYRISGTLFDSVSAFIDDRYVEQTQAWEYGKEHQPRQGGIWGRFRSRAKGERDKAGEKAQPFPAAARDNCPEPKPPAVGPGGDSWGEVSDLPSVDSDRRCASAPPPRRSSREEGEDSFAAASRPRPNQGVPVMASAPPVAAPTDLMDMMERMDAGFSETVLALIDRSGKKDSEIYKRANMDRKHFSKLRSNPHYQPSKPTALALAVALELDLPQTQELIARAGYTLSHSSKFDIIVEFFIQHRVYDIFEINATLFEFDQSQLR